MIFVDDYILYGSGCFDYSVGGWVFEVVGFDEGEDEVFLLVVVDEVGVGVVVLDYGFDVFDVELD